MQLGERALICTGANDFTDIPNFRPHPSTVDRVLTRYRMARLRWLDRPSGQVIRRIESSRCGVLVHLDVKKLGKIPVGGGWRMVGRSAGRRNWRADKSSGRRSKHGDPLHGHHFLHTALDGHSRLAYSELLGDERKETAAAFWRRANAWFSECGITVGKVLTDNGSCYRSHAFKDALAGIEHRRMRPYRPQTNGKIERFHRTLANDWGLRPFLHHRHSARHRTTGLAAFLQSL